MDDGTRAQIVRVGSRLAAAVLGVALVATLYGAIVDIHLRPLDGVEGAILFEASRIRAHLPLYVDPVVGAHEYGAIPARYYVLYPPVWSWMVSLLPETHAAVLARSFSVLAWWGLLAVIAARASKASRGIALAAAAFVGAVFMFAEFGATARPDPLALLLAGLAIERTVRRARLDSLAGALFALAVWVKPNVLGMAAGVFLLTIARSPRRALAPIGAALGVSAVVVAVLQVASSGAWLAHLVRSTGQPLHPILLWSHRNYLQFFAVYLLVAAWLGWRAREGVARDRALLGLAALGSSVGWCMLTLSKIGGAPNYVMEPCVAAAVLYAHLPVPAMSSRMAAAFGVLVPFQALWTCVGSVRSTFEALEQNAAHSGLVATARQICGAGPLGLVVSDEPGTEMTLDGRLVVHPFMLTHLSLRGEYPLGPWLADLARPEIACVVVGHDRIERPLSQYDFNYDYFALPVRDALNRRFVRMAEADGWVVYGPR